MATIKERIADAGEAVADTAKNVGHKIAENAEAAVDYVKEKTGMGGCENAEDIGVAGIKERMDVICSCGTKIGVVDHVEGNSLKLTKSSSPDGQHHFIPTSWVEKVHAHGHVHLNKTSSEACKEWKTDASSCNSTGSCSM